MFERAHRRLTLRYVGMFAIVLTTFSAIFLVVVATILAPNFDFVPEGVGAEGEALAYDVIIGRVAVALALADVAVLAVVGVAAWVLASRTLRPIREAHARQRRFVADASHEMRTPVAAIRSTAERALRDPAAPEAAQPALATILDASERLTRVTNDLLLLARTDEPAERRVERVDLSVIVAATIEADRAAHGSRDAVSVHLEPDLVVEADADEIGRIVGNLIDNAIRYSSARPSVTIVTSGSDRAATVEVADAGPGIAPADLDHIFEPFYRVRRDAAGPHGSGLGLAIAADLAARNGAHLTVDSIPDRGTTFRLTLPRFR